MSSNLNLSWASSTTETVRPYHISDISGSSSTSERKAGNSDKPQRKQGSTRSTRTTSLHLHLQSLLPWWTVRMAKTEAKRSSTEKTDHCSKIVSFQILSPLVPVQILPYQECKRSGIPRKGRDSSNQSLLLPDLGESSGLGVREPVPGASTSDPMAMAMAISASCSVADRPFLTAKVRNQR